MKEKVVYILRGPSGSGKSMLAAHIIKGLPKGVYNAYCSADLYHMNRGKYEFVAENQHHAHLSCQADFHEAIRYEIDVIVVDNTNTTAAEIEVYARAAYEAGYRVELVEPARWRDRTAEQLCARNTHAVPLTVIERQIENCRVPIRNEDLKTWFCNDEAAAPLKTAESGNLNATRK